MKDQLNENKINSNENDEHLSTAINNLMQNSDQVTTNANVNYTQTHQPVPAPNQNSTIASTSINQNEQYLQPQLQGTFSEKNQENIVQDHNDKNNDEDKYYTDNKRGRIAFLIFIIGVITMFGFKSIFGYGIVLIALIFSIVNRKYKHSLIKLTMILSTLLLIFLCIIIFAVLKNQKELRESLDESRQVEGQQCEAMYIEEARSYVQNLDVKPSERTIFKEENFSLDRKCLQYQWYVIYDPNTETYDAYLSGEYYTTDGFDSTNIE